MSVNLAFLTLLVCIYLSGQHHFGGADNKKKINTVAIYEFAVSVATQFFLYTKRRSAKKYFVELL